jgi:hypothetical protein
LIGQVLEAAKDVRYDADRLNSFNRSAQVSKWTHFHHLTRIRSSVNEGLQPAFQRLVEIQPKLPGWKQKRIDDMLESARALAADGNSAIVSRKDAGNLPPALNSEYRELVAGIYQACCQNLPACRHVDQDCRRRRKLRDRKIESRAGELTVKSAHWWISDIQRKENLREKAKKKSGN